MNKKVISTLAATALLASLAPMASAAPAAPVAPAEVKAAKVQTAAATDRILVRFKDKSKADAVASKHGAKADRTLGNGKSEWKVVKVPNGKAAEFLAKFQADSEVAEAELDHILTALVTPNDPSYGSQWQYPNVQGPQAWDITQGSTSRTVAIIDTGVDLQHPDLASKIVAGYDFVNNDTNADDDQGHGTHCAGIAAALSNNATNVAGMDWNARIMPVKVLSASGSGYTSDIIDGVYWAVDNGAHVLSMSLGGGSKNASFQAAIDYAWNNGRVVVAAAGNNGTSTRVYPGAYNNVISVAATTSSNVKASFSSYGTWVDVAAPGSSILSTKNGGGTTTMSGTSMATPLVAGLVSLTWSKNLSYSNVTVRDRIFNTTDAISGTGKQWIYGKVNAYKAVNGF
ncbi:S8 family peptidase [Tumebacillus sp. DT12]|uniref:S8 family peptidase n=1 Tax=Tumebacillus lacus TaxID=2995335 RepID=A0ABT3X2X3_9BACL|nr:S8 family peptidase [Tumebacillus lacus]MCX7571250.1 S8 family peptidase [Tumebacillus lacus]